MVTKIKPEAILAMEEPAQLFSTCVQIGDHFHFSCILPLDKHGPPKGNSREQIIKVIEMMNDLRISCGLRPEDIYSVNVMFVRDMENLIFFKDCWETQFSTCSIRPCFNVFAVAALPLGCAVGIDFKAVKQSE